MDKDRDLPSEPIAGTSGVKSRHSKRAMSRRSQTRSSSSSSSSTSSSSSSESSRDSRKKKRKSHRRRSNKRKRGHRLLEKLSKEVSELRKNIVNNDNICRDNDNESFISDVSRELYNDCCASQAFSTQSSQNPNTLPNLKFDFETKTKDPAVPSTPEEFLKILNDVQRFGNKAWSDVRYFETQKLYNHSPGFTELETNEEVKAYDKIRHLAYSDKSYAAMTFCILKQKEVFLNSCRNLLAWSKSPEASLSCLEDKIDEYFLKGDFHKVSTDLLQMACGHRAETIEMRRDGILKCVRDPLVRCKLDKIPPSNTHLFEHEALTVTLESAGGIRKTFWPANHSSSGNASRAKSTNAARLPSQGQARHNVPSRGTMDYCCNVTQSAPVSHHTHPSQGCYQPHFPSKGHNNTGNEQRFNNKGTSFRSRRSGPRQPAQRGQKRPFSPSGNKGGKRQRQ